MKGQKYWDEKVPIYTEIKEVREIRKKKYLNEAKQYYSICKHTTNEEYNHLKNEILNGNEKAMQELLERSINPIIDALAGIYAKYYIEEYVPFEEGLSYSLEMFNKRLKAFTKFPCLWSKFSISTIRLRKNSISSGESFLEFFNASISFSISAYCRYFCKYSLRSTSLCANASSIFNWFFSENNFWGSFAPWKSIHNCPSFDNVAKVVNAPFIITRPDLLFEILLDITNEFSSQTGNEFSSRNKFTHLQSSNSNWACTTHCSP